MIYFIKNITAFITLHRKNIRSKTFHPKYKFVAYKYFTKHSLYSQYNLFDITFQLTFILQFDFSEYCLRGNKVTDCFQLLDKWQPVRAFLRFQKFNTSFASAIRPLCHWRSTIEYFLIYLYIFWHGIHRHEVQFSLQTIAIVLTFVLSNFVLHFLLSNNSWDELCFKEINNESRATTFVRDRQRLEYFWREPVKGELCKVERNNLARQSDKVE